jgi:hypothetical protein
MGKYEIGEAPIKLADTHCYVRVSEEGHPQLIRIEPLFNDDGILIPISVLVYIDNENPVMMDRAVAEMIAAAYTPLENDTWKTGVN